MNLPFVFICSFSLCLFYFLSQFSLCIYFSPMKNLNMLYVLDADWGLFSTLVLCIWKANLSMCLFMIASSKFPLVEWINFKLHKVKLVTWMAFLGSKAHILLLNDIIKKDCWENVHRQEEYELFPCILLLCAETFPD